MMKEIFEALLKMENRGGSGVLVTVVEKEGHGPAAVGTRMLVSMDGSRTGTVGGGALEYAAVKWAEQMMKQGKDGGLKKYLLSPDNEVLDGEQTGMMCGGSTTLFYESIGCGARLYLFGAGHVNQALVHHLKHLDYFITVIDNREGLAEAIDSAHERITAASYETALDNHDIPSNSYFIIATHSHALDYVVLKRIYEANWDPKYIGMIASRKKAPIMIERLTGELGKEIDLSVLYSPMGLQIGGTTPADIAISVLAELQAIRYNKEGHKHMKVFTAEG
jgi:xanthine dehydrogenase accessory factor